MFGGMLMRSNSNQYEQITSPENANRNFWDTKSFFRSWSLMKIFMSGMVALLIGIIIVQGVHEHDVEIEHQEFKEEAGLQLAAANQEANRNNFVPFVSQRAKKVPVPTGVNIGSWLSLEDYFFAGMQNSVEVATPGQRDDADKIAACLPPLHVGSTTGPKWQSETDLFRNLMDPTITEGGSVKHAIEVFAAHRASYVDLETDLDRIAALGVTALRIPMSWCWTDTDPRKVDLGSYESDEDLLDDFACVDPFFGKDDSDPNNPMILWPAIPKPLIEELLRACSRVGIKASLDVHTLPGGTSIGTFSGVWPNWPRFWTQGGDGVEIEGSTVSSDDEGFGIGHKLFHELVGWMEDLSKSDPEAFAGLKGLSPMNEPAHLAGWFNGSDNPENFLPPLPKEMADDYREFLGSRSDSDYPDGTFLRVFYWFGGAADIFRKSKLPSLGIEFQANIHESALPALAEWWEDWTVDARLRGQAIAGWWCAQTKNEVTTSPQERSDWAVLDMHHYHAWSDVCSGTIDGQDAAYACGDAEKRSQVLDLCAQWVHEFRNIVDDVCGTTSHPKHHKTHSKLMSGEFSAASHHSVRRSCSDISGLRESYTKQVEQAESADVELYYWSYKMPYGGSFGAAGWSFSELMYKLGVLGRPDAPQFTCDAHQVYDPEIP